MKTLVQCQCGSAFNAPASLVGQVVKCPACGQAMTVPDPGEAQSEATARRAAAQAASQRSRAPGTAPGSAPGSAPGLAPEDEAGVSGLGSGGAAGLRAGRSGSSMGGAAMRSGIGSAASGADNPNLSRDLCPRCKAVVTQGGRLCTTCLYEMHTGQSAGARGKFKFTLGMGVALALLVVAASAGVWIVMNTGSAPPTVATQPPPADPTPPTVVETPQTDPTGGEPSTVANASPAPAAGGRQQMVVSSRQWDPSGAIISPALARASVTVAWDPATGERTFGVVIAPARGASLRMGTTVRLFRGESAEGPFRQVDASTPTGTESGGALTFSLFDATATAGGHNRLYYLVSGDDGGTTRLFDTPPAAFPVLAPPRVSAGRVKWEPINPAEPVPPLRVAFVVDAPGWEGAVLDQVTAEGAIDVPLPPVQRLPLKAVLQVAGPTGIELANGGTDGWRVANASYALYEAGAGDASTVGILPTWRDGELTYSFLPDPEPFLDVVEQSPASAVAGSRLLSFRVGSAGSLQLLELHDPPMVQNVAVTPFDRKVHLTWDNRALLAAKGRYAGEVAVAIFRQVGNGPRQVIAMLPPDAAGYVDAAVTNGTAYRYDVQITSATSADATPLLRTNAFVAGQGSLPVLVSVEPRAAGSVVVPEPGLHAFTVAIGPSELAYPYTDEAAVAALQAVRSTLAQAPGVDVIERDMLMRSRAATDAGLLGAPGEPIGLPAHVQLRVLDAATPTGLAIELWATDLVTGESTRLASTPVDAPDPDAFASAVQALAAARAPDQPPAQPAGQPPAQVVFGQLVPLDQPALFLGGADVMEDLAQLVDRRTDLRAAAIGNGLGDASLGVPGTVLISGRAWHGEGRDPNVILQAVDATTGRNLGSFQALPLDNAAEDRLVEWCGSLTTAVPVAPAAALGYRSVLLTNEAAVPPLHPVWQEMAGSNSTPRLPAPTMPRLLPTLPGRGRLTHASFNFGLPLPVDLAPYRPTSRRDPAHPLAAVRPYIASADPVTFESWVAGYARYLSRDYEAFVRGLEKLAAAVRGGPVAPEVFVRGQAVFTGNVTIDRPPPLTRDPQALNLRGALPLGATGHAAIDYRSELEQTFRQRPYAAYHAWKAAPRDLAEPFLKCIVLGVEGGNYGEPELNFNLPPDFDQYLAAVALGDMGNGLGINYRRRGLQVAATTYQQLARQVGLTHLTDRQAHYVTNAMLILAFENDPVVLGALRDPQVLQAFVQPQPTIAADAVRLLVDRGVPAAWEWAAELPGMDWTMFLWRSQEEMRLVTDTMPDAMPEQMYAHVRRMIGAEPIPRPHDPRTPTSQPSNLARPMFPQ